MNQAIKSKKLRKAMINIGDCVACGCCVKVCPRDAISIIKGVYASVDESRCVGCGKCRDACPASVIAIKELTA